ncbi:hypothetical protein [Vibrio sp. V39_P1S14PM300]|uniref:hypothetical protein n=1 Tax=Vibrio sp. V39_P1S14PM300 TaxID=1938690 RepID=UPI001F1B6D01|nr:hypothetical protein [Vibrio sp. V39_P1S14PM300]
MMNLLNLFKGEEATVCYELNGCAADKKLGIAVRGSVDLKHLRTPNDVSVKDAFMAGTIDAIIEKLGSMEDATPRYFYVTNRYDSIKIWINKSSKELNAATACPFGNAIVHNTGHLIMTAATAGFADTVSPILKTALESPLGANNAQYAAQAAETIMSKAAGQFSPVGKNASASTDAEATGFSLAKGLLTDAKYLVNGTRQALKGNKNSDVNFTGMPVETPPHKDKTKRRNKIKSLIHKAKQVVSPEKLIIRVGSEFNKHHAGTVIDLGVRAISFHDLIEFLTYYAEEHKLVNCFHDRSGENGLTNRVNVI